MGWGLSLSTSVLLVFEVPVQGLLSRPPELRPPFRLVPVRQASALRALHRFVLLPEAFVRHGLVHHLEACRRPVRRRVRQLDNY
jgi:hypothetical protein